MASPLGAARPPTPHGMRWLLLSDTPGLPLSALRTRYYAIVDKIATQPLTEAQLITFRQIEVDVPRTAARRLDTEVARDRLRRVLAAAAEYDPDCCYVQGQSFIVAALLKHVPEADAFALFIRLLHSPLYDFRRFFLPGLPDHSIISGVIDELMRQHLPDLHAHLASVDVGTIYLMEWWHTLFSLVLPEELLAEAWGLVFADGFPAACKIVLALLAHLKPYLLSRPDFAGVVSVLKAYTRARTAAEFPEAIPRGATVPPLAGAAHAAASDGGGGAVAPAPHALDGSAAAAAVGGAGADVPPPSPSAHSAVSAVGSALATARDYATGLLGGVLSYVERSIPASGAQLAAAAHVSGSADGGAASGAEARALHGGAHPAHGVAGGAVGIGEGDVDVPRVVAAVRAVIYASPAQRRALMTRVLSDAAAAGTRMLSPSVRGAAAGGGAALSSLADGSGEGEGDADEGFLLIEPPADLIARAKAIPVTAEDVVKLRRQLRRAQEEGQRLAQERARLLASMAAEQASTLERAPGGAGRGR